MLGIVTEIGLAGRHVGDVARACVMGDQLDCFVDSGRQAIEQHEGEKNLQAMSAELHRRTT